MIISSSTAEAIIDPDLGGALRIFSIDGVAVTQDGSTAVRPSEMGCFLMVPWVNRIERGKFATPETIHSIPPNRDDEPHPLHGHGWQTSWEVVDHREESVTLRMVHAGDGWPWPYSAHVRYLVEPDRLMIDLEVTNRGDSVMPTSIGFHPHFDRPARLSATIDGVWMTDEQLIPTLWEEAEPFRLSSVDGMDLDNTFTGWDGRAYIDIDGGRIEMVSDLKRLHLYVPRWKNSFAVEPVSAAPDAVNHPNRGSVGLAPGESLHHWMRLVLVRS